MKSFLWLPLLFLTNVIGNAEKIEDSDEYEIEDAYGGYPVEDSYQGRTEGNYEGFSDSDDYERLSDSDDYKGRADKGDDGQYADEIIVIDETEDKKKDNIPNFHVMHESNKNTDDSIKVFGAINEEEEENHHIGRVDEAREGDIGVIYANLDQMKDNGPNPGIFRNEEQNEKDNEVPIEEEDPYLVDYEEEDDIDFEVLIREKEKYKFTSAISKFIRKCVVMKVILAITY